MISCATSTTFTPMLGLRYGPGTACKQAKLAGEDHVSAMLLALESLPDKIGGVDRPFVDDAHLKQRERAVLVGHKGTVNSAVFSADGVFIITASNDQTARVWRAYSDPKELVKLPKSA